mgnify:CR=1 FL=1
MIMNSMNGGKGIGDDMCLLLFIEDTWVPMDGDGECSLDLSWNKVVYTHALCE